MGSLRNSSQEHLSSLDKDPWFPAEIEQEIFILAFHAEIDDQLSLILVAKRVSEWLIPFIYKVVLMESNEWGAISDPHPPLSSLKRYGHHVRRLFVSADMDRFPDWGSQLLRLCPNVWDLGFWYGTSLTPDVLDLPIKRILMDDFKFLKNRLDKNPSDVRLIRWCSKVTHIGLREPLDGSTIRYLVHFPALRYLMMLESESGFGDNNAVLMCCPHLKVVIQVLRLVSDEEVTQVLPREGENGDIRVVMVDGIVMRDWIQGTTGLPDMWKLSEDEVERRRNGSRNY